jgi:acyl-CoA thioesterase
MLFSETLASLKPQASGLSAVIGEDWSQGRATFGGLVSALGNQAMRSLVAQDRELRGLETTFVGPVLAGTVNIQAEVLRVGKAVSIASARIWSADKVAATLTGIYGAARSTAITVAPQAAVKVPVIDSLAPAAESRRGGPAFLQHFDFRWAQGTRPFSGNVSRLSKTYVRHTDPAPSSESHIVALIDCIPSAILQMMSTPAPSSSLTWTLQLLRHDYSFAPDAWWRIDAEVNSAADGYSCESCMLIDPNGVPAAFSRQMVAVFG